MGTELRLTLVGTDGAAAGRAATNAFAEARRLEDILSHYRDESELRRLPRREDPGQPVSEDLWNVLAEARRISRDSGGAFDVTVGPLVLAWTQSRMVGRLPAPELLAARREVTGWELVVLDETNRTVRLARPRMRLDLGGIAKGYIADRTLASLADDGFPQALVDAGGDLALGDPPPGAEGWLVEVRRPKGATGSAAGTATGSRWLSRCGIATSGARHQFLEVDGVRYSHIVDPRTGLGVTHPWQVTVIAPDCMRADAWASALSVLGREAGAKAAAQQAGLEVIWIAEPGAAP